MKLAVITNDETQVFQRQVIKGVTREAGRHDAAIQVVNTNTSLANWSGLAVKPSDFDGAVVIANALDDDALIALWRAGVPATLISHQLIGAPMPSVLPDNTGGTVQMVDYLAVACGCKRIAYIQGNLDQTDGVERWKVFQQELLRHDLPLDNALVLRGDFEQDIARDSVAALVASGVKFDAVAAADYLMGIAALEVLRGAGVPVPDAVCVIGFGDGPEAADAGLTTVGVDVEDIGIHAAKQVFGQIRGMAMRGVTMLATDIIPRQTC
jgi:DNA-binding LacI/PurR family transcriptional regulator